MPASEGTPTVIDKLKVGIETLFGHAPTAGPDAATLAGIKADLQKDLTTVETLFGPVLQEVKTDGLGDLASFLQAELTAIPDITSVSQAMAIVKASAGAEAGTINAQLKTISQSSLTALVSAALTAVGKAQVPLT